MSRAQAVQAQIEALNGWLNELTEHLDDEQGRVVPFDYSESLAAAMELHGIEDPDTAFSVFSERLEALSGLRDRL
ncbi:MAG: hypothetical protein AB1425_01955 [Actinomycetota bacterium]